MQGVLRTPPNKRRSKLVLQKRAQRWTKSGSNVSSVMHGCNRIKNWQDRSLGDSKLTPFHLAVMPLISQLRCFLKLGTTASDQAMGCSLQTQDAVTKSTLPSSRS
jgi:hypothetical protein